MLSLWPKKGPKKDKEISLSADGCCVQVRRSALVKHSPVFAKMAENKELKRSREVRLKGVTAVGLLKIAEYFREDSVYFKNHREAIETLRAAHLYQVQAANDICTNFLVTTIDCQNVCDIFEFSSAYPFHLVEYHCLRFIDRCAGEVLKSDSFLDLKRSTVADIVRRQSLDVPSEIVVFRAVMAWATRECLKKNIDPKNVQEIYRSAKSLLGHVRFMTLSDDELSDPEVDAVHRLMMSPEDSSGKRRSFLSLDMRSRSGTSDTTYWQAREYVKDYGYALETLHCDEHAVKNGESFCLRVEVLKGRVFLTGIAVSFEKFVSRKNTSCLYAVVSATNVQSTEQRCARGTFMEEDVLRFPSPLVAKESERVEIALQVKRAVNICSVVIASDVQIAMPESKDVALKIIPSSMTGGTERSMFKSVQYFY